MTKEELLPLIQADRPSQKILEVIDFKPSDRGIDGEQYLVTVSMVTIGCCSAHLNSEPQIFQNLPYPLGPSKEINHRKIKITMNNFKDNLKNILKNE
jgi:hypothetical protein